MTTQNIKIEIERQSFYSEVKKMESKYLRLLEESLLDPAKSGYAENALNELKGGYKELARLRSL